MAVMKYLASFNEYGAQEGKGKNGNFKHPRENTGVAQIRPRAHSRVNKQFTNAWLILCNPNITFTRHETSSSYKCLGKLDLMI